MVNSLNLQLLVTSYLQQLEFFKLVIFNINMQMGNIDISCHFSIANEKDDAITSIVQCACLIILVALTDVC